MIKTAELKEIVNKVLKKHKCLEEKDGIFKHQIYLEYNDYLDNDFIVSVLEKDSVESRYSYFMDQLYIAYDDEIVRIIHSYKGYILDYIEEKYPDIDYYEVESELEDILSDILIIELPDDEYLNTKVLANLVLDTGDANYDFSINELLAIRDSGLSEESSILWVALSQGYSKKETQNAILNGEYKESKFLKTLAEEVLNAHYMNAFTFLIDSTLRELMDFDKKSIKSVKVNKNTNCGLVDFWYGAGGMIDIELEKDIEIPSDIIDSFTIDGLRGTYSIDNIYGMSSDAWNGSAKYIFK